MSASHSSIKVMIISLASAVVLLAGLLIVFFAINKEETDQTAGELIPLIACNENEINSLHIESARDTYNIVSDGVKDYIPQWRIEGRDNTDIDQYSVKTVLNRCYKLNARRELGTVDISDSEMMAAYGFDKPTATVTVDYKDGIRTFVVGAAYGKDYYMYEKGTGRYYVVPSTVGLYFSMTVDELRTLPSLAVSMGNVGVISLRRRDAKDMNIAYMPSFISGSSVWQMTSPVSGFADNTAITEYTNSISDFKMSLYVDSAVGEDLAKYGLEEPYATLVLAPHVMGGESSDKPSQIIAVGDPLKEIEGYRYCYSYTFKKGDEVDASKCRLYAISDETFNKIFNVNAINIVDRNVLMTNIVNVTSIDMEIQGKKSTMSITKKTLLDDDGNPIVDESGKATYETFFDMQDGQRLKASCARAFFSRLITLKISAFVRDDDPQEIGNKVFDVAIHTDIKPYGLSDSKVFVDLTAEAYELDSNYYVLRFHGQKENSCKISRKQLDELFEAYDLMLKGELPALRD